MADDNILPFPNKLRDAIDEEAWRALQGEFYLDCYFAHHGKPADGPEQLRVADRAAAVRRHRQPVLSRLAGAAPQRTG